MTDRPAKIGPYEVGAEIGRGGMGVVYLGRDTALERPVAIKAIPERWANDAERIERLTREARSLALLNHPGVAGIYGVVEHQGRTYLILEYVEGETLADRIDAGPLPFDEAIRLAIEIAAGIEAAHDAGVTHRDLKPDNIKITPAGHAKVLDFGLARAVDAESSTGAADDPTMVTPRSPTMPGAILGTAAYMSPEQARGRRVDSRSDTWSFGVVLYEMLSGVSPFAAGSAQESIGAVLHKDADFDRLPAATPESVRRVLRRCLERDASRRYHHVADARLDLEDAIAAADAREPDRSTRPRRMVPLAAAALVLGIGAGALGWFIAGSRTPTRTVVRSAVLAPEGVAIDAFRISPDGLRLSIVGVPASSEHAPGRRTRSLYQRDLASTSMTQVPQSQGAFEHAYSPDGRTLAFITRGDESSDPERLMRVPADGSSAPLDVLSLPPELRWGPEGWFCWTPGSELALFDRSHGVLNIFDAGSGRELRRVQVERADPETRFGGLAGPFGDRFVQIAVERFKESGFQFDMGLIDVATGRFRWLAEDCGVVSATPRGNVVFSRDDALYMSEFDADRFAVTGPLRRVQGGLATSALRDATYQLADDGTLAYLAGGVRGAARQIVIIDRDGRETPWIDELRAFDAVIAVSPDASRLAVVIAGPGGLYEIWVSETNRPRLRRLLAAPGSDFSDPTFSPDGEYLVVSSWAPAEVEPRRVLLVRFDGTGAPRRLDGGSDKNTTLMSLSVSADGSRVIKHQRRAGVGQLYEVSMDGAGTPRLLLEEQEFHSVCIAPTDDRLLAYISTATGRAEGLVRTVSEDGLGPAIPVTAQGVWSLDWIVDDRLGLCILHFDFQRREWITPIRLENGRVEVGESSLTGRLDDDGLTATCVSRDGRRFAIRRGADERPATHIEIARGWLDAVERR